MIIPRTTHAARSTNLARTQPIRLIEQDGAELGLAGAIMSGARVAQGEILLVMRIHTRVAHLAADRVPEQVPPWPIH